MSEHVYQVRLDWMEGKRGTAVSDGRITLPVGSPPQFDGYPDTWSPEHLLATATAGCYMTTFVFFCNLLKVPLKSLHVGAELELEKLEGGPFWAKTITLKPVFSFDGDVPKEKIDSILQKSKKYCIVSNSLKSDVRVVTG